jgi:hypothetical protein
MAYKKLDLNAQSFETSKHKYTFKTWLTFDEWREFENYEFQTGMGATFENVFRGLVKTYESMNDKKFADTAVHIHNLISGIKEKMEKRWHPALIICTLFTIRDGDEDRVWSEALANEYIEDWKEYEVNGFFSLAVGLVRGFSEAYEEISRDSFNKLKTTISNTMSNGKRNEIYSGTKSQSESHKTTDLM